MGGSAPRRDAHLPVETTSFVDRRAELAEARELLARARLVTLTGPGGVGKTRLAGRIAARVARAFPDGVRFVHLSGLHDPALVPLAAADALGLHDRSERPALDALVERVRDRRLLLVVDNCEHLPAACADLAGALLRGTTGVRVLATSRHRLGLTEEHLMDVRPLAVPDPDGDLGDAAGHPALALFADRAAAVVPGFRLTPANRASVARLCRRLDGLPLAIELAAVRLRVLGVDQLLDRLDDRYRLLSAGSPAVPPRHRTLRAAVDWSHDLCTAREQTVWARLSVLAGSFDLETAEAVGGDGDGTPPGDVLEAVAGLVDKSVLCRESGPDGVRYRLLDTLRAYGLERLRARPGEERAARDRQRDWMQRRADACERAWFGPGQSAVVARLRADRDNLRAALDHSLGTPGEERAALRLAGTLWFHWHACGAPREGRYWLDRALEADPEPTPERARALWAAGLLAGCPEDVTRGLRRAEEARDLARALGDEAEAAHAAYVVGVTRLFAGDVRGALDHFRTGVARGRVPGQHLSMAGLDRVELACALALLGEADQAIAVCEETRRTCAEHGEQWVLSYVERMLALAHTVRADWARAERHGREALRLKHAVHDVVGIGLTLDLLARVAAGRAEPERAAVLLGVADRVWADVDPDRWGSADLTGPRQDSERYAAGALGRAAYRRAYARGAALTLAAAVEQALDTGPAGTDPAGRTATATHDPAPAPARTGPTHPGPAHPDPTHPGAARTDPTHPGPAHPVPAPRTPGPRPSAGRPSGARAPEGVRLTRRETQVAELVAQGLANQQIADRLVIARRTAEGHVERILGKLGFSNRSQIAAWVAGRR
ncbi:LuxR C-terminal-related transcriptional regulator [Streptomyces longwoodensis]|uniref:LuxR C-terminal-related transcriptional regulator n=1 Tax=Streptomyces longwoodensis TaxID=68231 RepID=UPI002DD7DF91|nr:LuxR C-terminal-related transcriptional regulator [Streptomyces longwoodensis]WRY90385.1 LuxR C-terminal-related transcriptional regulator [Streptomyces longwoodensis]